MAAAKILNKVECQFTCKQQPYAGRKKPPQIAAALAVAAPVTRALSK